MEQLTDKNQQRFSLFPIKYPDMWHMYQQHIQMFWTPNEVDLTQDAKDWDTLTANEQHFIKYVLAFFNTADGIVSENLATMFYNEVQIPEARAFYSFQLAMEQIHANQYSLMIESLIQDKEEQDFLFKGIETIPCLQRKADWVMKWINNQDSFAIRLIAFAAVEGIMFAGSFCSIFWLKKRGIMPGLSLGNEFISRDESLHCDFACLLFSYIQNKPSTDQILEIIKGAVEIEKEFVTSALPVSLIGMNSDQMCQYIQFVADRLLVQLKCPQYYKVENPFEWMQMISLQGKTNFFEKRVSEYQKITSTTHKFELDEDF